MNSDDTTRVYITDANPFRKGCNRWRGMELMKDGKPHTAEEVRQAFAMPPHQSPSDYVRDLVVCWIGGDPPFTWKTLPGKRYQLVRKRERP